MFLAQFAVFVWIAVSVVAITLGTISLYHPRLKVSHSFWLWWISALVSGMAAGIFASISANHSQVTCGVNLVIFLIYTVPIVAVMGHTSRIKEGTDPYLEAIRSLRAGAFGCLLGALVSSGLIIGVPYLAIALSFIISLGLPYFTLLLLELIAEIKS